MSGKKPGEDSIAEKLEETRWEYSPHDDPRFLLAPIGEIFGTFCWDGAPGPSTTTRKNDDEAD